MIATLLIPQLKQKFPAKPFTVSSNDQTIITFPAANPDVGDLEIHDDGDELTIVIGRIMHSHITCHNDQLSLAARQQNIVSDAIDFIDSIFNEKTEFYTTSSGGGIGPRGCGEGDIFVWSGRVTDDKL